MLAGAKKRIGGKVIECVVHIAHIPLEAKAETTERGRHCYHRIGGGFLGYGYCTGILRQHRGVELSQKLNGGKIYVSAVTVRRVFAVLSAVI